MGVAVGVAGGRGAVGVGVHVGCVAVIVGVGVCHGGAVERAGG